MLGRVFIFCQKQRATSSSLLAVLTRTFAPHLCIIGVRKLHVVSPAECALVVDVAKREIEVPPGSEHDATRGATADRVEVGREEVPIENDWWKTEREEEREGKQPKRRQ